MNDNAAITSRAKAWTDGIKQSRLGDKKLVPLSGQRFYWPFDEGYRPTFLCAPPLRLVRPFNRAEEMSVPRGDI